MEKRLTVLVPENMDGRMVKDVARSCLSLSSTRLKKAKRIPSGVICSIPDSFDSFHKVQRIADYVLTGHEPEVLRHSVYPNPDFPRKQTKSL